MRHPTWASGLILLSFTSFVPIISALQANLAGVVDWHKPLIGSPLLEPTPPSFAGNQIIAITKKNILAVLDAESGNVRWRHLLEDHDPVISYHVQDDNVLLLSGPSAATVRLFSLGSGHVLWERTLIPDITAAHIINPVHLGTDAVFTDEAEGAVVILSEGRRVSKLALTDGSVQWSLEAPGVGSTVLFKQLLVSGSTVHILALTSSFASNTLTTMSLDLTTSAPLADMTQIPSFVKLPSDAMLVAGSSPGVARVIWYEHGRIRSAYLSAGGQLGDTKDLLPGAGKLYTRILDVGMRRKGFVLGQMERGAVDIIDVTAGAKIVDTFADSGDSRSERTRSLYSAAESDEGIIFNRIYWSHKIRALVAQTYSVSSSGDIISSGYTNSFDTQAHGVLIGAAVSNTVNAAQLPTLMYTTSSDALQLVKQEGSIWTREESLSDIVAIRFVDLGEPEVAEVRHVMAEEGFLRRLTRHILEFRMFPAYIFRFIRRFASASYSSAVSTTPLSLDRLHRDQFGLQKLLVAVTKGGKLFAMDSANGNVVWCRNLGGFYQSGPNLDVRGMWLVRELGESGSPTLAILGVKTEPEGITTVGFQLNAFTGRDWSEDPDVKDAALYGTPPSKELFEGKVETAFLLPFENCGTKNRVLAVVDSDFTLHIFPSCKKVASGLANMSSKLFFTTTDRTLAGTTLHGRMPASPARNTSFHTSELWARTFGAEETVVSVDPVGFQAVASFGRVLGDKSTLYKYLNPHLSVVTTVIPSAGTAHVYVLDTTTGGTIYSAQMDDVLSGEGVKSVMAENWLVYAWPEKSGWRIASVELYEDRSGGKTETPDSSSPSSDGQVRAISKTFISTTAVKAISMTNSKVGIAAKEIVFVNGQNQITTLPRRLLDPRRPMGKPTSYDREELLIPYDPLIPSDPKRAISHEYQILGTTSLVSSSALLESTSLLLAHGLDIFLTRGLTPSGTFDILSDSFNKVQLLLTLGVLSVGIFVARPAVQRKALRARWY